MKSHVVEPILVVENDQGRISVFNHIIRDLSAGVQPGYLNLANNQNARHLD